MANLKVNIGALECKNPVMTASGTFGYGPEYEDLRLNIQNAHKTDKSIMYDNIRDLLRRGDLLLIKGGKCEHEALSTILKRGPNGEVYNEVDLKAYHPDLLPAMRYALWNAIGM